MRAELTQLWTIERPRVTQEVADAAAQGDRSENAEYIYGKRRLREIDSRFRFLSKRLEVLKIVSEAPSDPTRVFFGAWVKVENEDGDQTEYRVVGPDETDADQQWISMDAPLARGLLGKRIDDEVVIEAPRGRVSYTIVAVRYA
jgi:transcription elongation factor GreB